MAKRKTSTPQQKLAWLKKQRDYWYDRANPRSGEYSQHAENKLTYYTDKIRYWEARIRLGGHDAEALAQSIRNRR